LRKKLNMEDWVNILFFCVLIVLVVFVIYFVVTNLSKNGKKRPRKPKKPKNGGKKSSGMTGETAYRQVGATPASATATMVGDGVDSAYQAANSPPGMKSSGPAPPEQCPDDSAIRMPKTATLENLLPNSLRKKGDQVKEYPAGPCTGAPQEWAKLAPDKDGVKKYVKSGAQAAFGVSDQVKDPTGRIQSAEPWFKMPTTTLGTKVHPFNESGLRVDIMHDTFPEDMVDPMSCSLGARRRV
jgi:hypothetical protein